MVGSGWPDEAATLQPLSVERDAAVLEQQRYDALDGCGQNGDELAVRPEGRHAETRARGDAFRHSRSRNTSGRFFQSSQLTPRVIGKLLEDPPLAGRPQPSIVPPGKAAAERHASRQCHAASGITMIR
jgi:hypothetical protein